MEVAGSQEVRSMKVKMHCPSHAAQCVNIAAASEQDMIGKEPIEHSDQKAVRLARQCH